MGTVKTKENVKTKSLQKAVVNLIISHKSFLKRTVLSLIILVLLISLFWFWPFVVWAQKAISCGQKPVLGLDTNDYIVDKSIDPFLLALLPSEHYWNDLGRPFLFSGISEDRKHLFCNEKLALDAGYATDSRQSKIIDIGLHSSNDLKTPLYKVDHLLNQGYNIVDELIGPGFYAEELRAKSNIYKAKYQTTQITAQQVPDGPYGPVHQPLQKTGQLEPDGHIAEFKAAINMDPCDTRIFSSHVRSLLVSDRWVSCNQVGTTKQGWHVYRGVTGIAVGQTHYFTIANGTLVMIDESSIKFTTNQAIDLFASLSDYVPPNYPRQPELK